LLVGERVTGAPAAGFRPPALVVFRIFCGDYRSDLRIGKTILRKKVGKIQRLISVALVEFGLDKSIDKSLDVYVTFAERGNITWIISARKANKREQRRYG
jgi:hypothetical protein